MEYVPHALGVVFLCCISGAIFVPVYVSMEEEEQAGSQPPPGGEVKAHSIAEKQWFNPYPSGWAITGLFKQ